MEVVTIAIVTLLAATLTFFTGFGLGTLLLPAFALFLPVELAVAATAVVHLANNMFKLLLIGRRADFKVVLTFGLPAVLFALLGAVLLTHFAQLPPLLEYSLGGRVFQITPVKLVVAVLIAVFSLFELNPRMEQITFSPRLVPLGGALSGFFGGLSGHQGALRSAFLIRLGLEKEIFVGTVVVSAILVDLARLSIYGVTFFLHETDLLRQQELMNPIIVGMVAAFAGSLIGHRLLKKVTLRHIQVLIGSLLVVYALSLGAGII